MDKYAFVTVGTTQFDLLIETIIQNPDVIHVLVDLLKIKKIVLQTGRSQMPSFDHLPIAIEHYQYKDSIENDIQHASLVISHAGAGTILQTLEAHRPLLVVVNEKLMNNHQLEIAHEMEKQGYLFHCTCSTLDEGLKKLVNHQFQLYEKGDPTLFGRYLNRIMA